MDSVWDTWVFSSRDYPKQGKWILISGVKLVYLQEFKLIFNIQTSKFWINGPSEENQMSSVTGVDV